MTDLSMNVRESEIPAGVAVSQCFMIQPHQMQQSGMQIVHMHGFVDCVHAELVGLTVSKATLNPTTRQKH